MINRQAITLLLCLFAIAGCSTAPVMTGTDNLQRDGYLPLATQRVALITNHTGVDRNGRSSLLLMHNADNVALVRIFSPEHGIAGRLDVENIGDSVDPDTGIPVFSLYGATRGPTATMLEDVDTLVFDIQDVGTRFYTYISTMVHAMQAAAEYGVRFVVLDRPNPINGIAVAGPVLEEGQQSFVGIHRLPVRHGMTVGELALMFNAELEIGVELEVIEMSGWRREQFFDITGLPWINPSPNIRSLDEALLYPGIGLLETTNLSVGRGTATPFELVGAPWIDSAALVQKLNNAGLQGVAFQAISFTPESSKHAGELCHGINIRITDRSRFEPLQTGFEIARQLALAYPETWTIDAYLRLLGNQRVLQAVREGLPYPEILASYADGLAEFRERRERFLLYRCVLQPGWG